MLLGEAVHQHAGNADGSSDPGLERDWVAEDDDGRLIVRDSVFAMTGNAWANGATEGTATDGAVVRLTDRAVLVVANGNVRCKADADRCMVETGVDGVATGAKEVAPPHRK